MPMRHVAAIAGIAIGAFACVAAVLFAARVIESVFDLYR